MDVNKLECKVSRVKQAVETLQKYLLEMQEDNRERECALECEEDTKVAIKQEYEEVQKDLQKELRIIDDIKKQSFHSEGPKKDEHGIVQRTR